MNDSMFRRFWRKVAALSSITPHEMTDMSRTTEKITFPKRPNRPIKSGMLPRIEEPNSLTRER